MGQDHSNLTMGFGQSRSDARRLGLDCLVEAIISPCQEIDNPITELGYVAKIRFATTACDELRLD